MHIILALHVLYIVESLPHLPTYIQIYSYTSHTQVYLYRLTLFHHNALFLWSLVVFFVTTGYGWRGVAYQGCQALGLK